MENELEIYKNVIPFLITYPKGKLTPDSVKGFHREYCLKKFKKHFGFSWKDEYVKEVYHLEFKKNYKIVNGVITFKNK